MSNETISLLAVAAVVIAAIVAFGVVLLGRQKLLRAALAEREALLSRLSERFEGSPDFIAFASSADAERLFHIADGPSALARRLLSLVAAAIAVSAIGLAMLINSFAPLPSPDINYVREALETRYWAIMFLAVGIGLALAAGVCTRLARRWGLLPA